ncbi:MAG: S8 family serine peptidase [Anaerolineaceae bacterium]
MGNRLPLLVFPSSRTVPPLKAKPFPPSKPHFPPHSRQVERLTTQLGELQQDFSRYKAALSGVMAGFEPELVLVIEIAGSVDNFKQAIEATIGLEWLGEWDIEDIEPDTDFFEFQKIGVDFFKNKVEGITSRDQSNEIVEILREQRIIDDEGKFIFEEIPEFSLSDHLVHLRKEIIQALYMAKGKKLNGRLFLSLSNEQGLRELLILWKEWEKRKHLPRGKTKWRDVFTQTLKIRRWGIEETLRESGVIDLWSDLLQPIDSSQEISCQIEMFYRQKFEKRKQNETVILSMLADMGGKAISPFIDMPNIAFHAVKAKFPAERIRHLLNILNSPIPDVDIQLFKYQGIMYFRPTGQSLVSMSNEGGVDTEFPQGNSTLPPIVAILDGVPNLQHNALKGRLLFDDPDNLAAEYRAGERKHGTAMASLVIHGEQTNANTQALANQVYFLPIMQPNPRARKFKNSEEYFPDEVFFEDRIFRAVRRMFEGEGIVPPQAPSVKVINISIGDLNRPFIHSSSPWAKLLDWLSWRYRVLFCVSAGNYDGEIEIGIPSGDFSVLPDEQKVVYFINCIKHQLRIASQLK